MALDLNDKPDLVIVQVYLTNAYRVHHGSLKHQAKHFFYASGWKKFEPLWDMPIRARQLTHMTPLPEAVLSRLTARRASQATTSDSPILPILTGQPGPDGVSRLAR